MSITVLDINAKEIGKEDVVFLPKSDHPALAHNHYLLNNYQGNALRAGTSSSKTRADVSGGGAKPYNQKGTGHARRGSNRTPLRRGGGVIFGPKPRSFKTKLNKKNIQLATRSVLNEKSDQISVLRFEESSLLKTRDIVQFLTKKNIQKNQKVVFVLDMYQDLNIELAVRNIKNVQIVFHHMLRVTVLLDADAIFFSQIAWDSTKERVLS